MGGANLSLAKRFLPLVHTQNNERSICYQNVLDLKETGLLEKLETIDAELAALPFARRTAASKVHVAAFAQCLRALRHVADAQQFSHAGEPGGEAIIVTLAGATLSLPPQHFMLAPIEACFRHIGVTFAGHVEECEPACTGAWAVLSRDHVLEFYRTLDVIAVPPRQENAALNEVIVNIPQSEAGKPLSPGEREARFAYALEMLKLYCYPGVHRTGFAASLTPVATLNSIGVMRYAENKGFDMLQSVLDEQRKVHGAKDLAEKTS